MTLANSFTHDPRVYNEAKTLIKAGHSVTVFCWDRENTTQPTDKIDEINVVRSYNTRLMNLLKHDVLRMPLWWKKGYKEAVKLHKKHNFDIVHSHDLSSLYIGRRLKREYGLPLIYDAHEIYGHLIVDDVSIIFQKLAFNTEKKWVQSADRLITVNEPLQYYFRSIYNKPITIIMNCKDLQGSKYEPTKNDKFTLLYLGTLDPSRFLIDLPDVVKDIPDVRCVIGGEGRPEFEQDLKNECDKVSNVDFIGMLPMEEVLPMTKTADAIICMFDFSNKNNKAGLPNKLFEAMVFGRPIICTKGAYSGDFVEKVGCGLSVDYDSNALKQTIMKLKDDPKLCRELGESGLKAAHKQYNWENQAEKLMKVYEGLT